MLATEPVDDAEVPDGYLGLNGWKLTSHLNQERRNRNSFLVCFVFTVGMEQIAPYQQTVSFCALVLKLRVGH